MSTTIDARGLACPAPVLLVKSTLEEQSPPQLRVLLDNQASSENVARFLTSQGYGVTEAKEGTAFVVLASGNGPPSAEQPDSARPPAVARQEAEKKIVVLIGGEMMGSGDPELGRKLMINYLRTLKEMGSALWQLIFINGGVRLTIDESPVLETIRSYEEGGVIVLACGTCLEHFGLSARKAVGTTTNMLDIVTASQLADKVITLG